MTTDNPYRPPQVELTEKEETTTTPKLATLSQRFFGSLIDGVLALVIVLPVQVALGLFDGFPDIQEPAFTNTAVGAGLGVLAYILVHGYFLREGQTIGKRLIGMRIVRLDYTTASAGRIISLRFIPMALLGLAPIAGTWLHLLGILLIFGASRRCLHDYIAQTQVIQV